MDGRTRKVGGMSKQIRQVVIESVELGISPISIVAGLGFIVSADEAEYLREYGKGYLEKLNT